MGLEFSTTAAVVLLRIAARRIQLNQYLAKLVKITTASSSIQRCCFYVVAFQDFSSGDARVGKHQRNKEKRGLEIWRFGGRN